MDILDAGWVFLSHFPLRSGDRLARTRARKSYLTRCIVCSKTLAIRHFGQFEACSRISNLYPLILFNEGTRLS